VFSYLSDGEVNDGLENIGKFGSNATVDSQDVSLEFYQFLFIFRVILLSYLEFVESGGEILNVLVEVNKVDVSEVGENLSEEGDDAGQIVQDSSEDGLDVGKRLGDGGLSGGDFLGADLN